MVLGPGRTGRERRHLNTSPSSRAARGLQGPVQVGAGGVGVCLLMIWETQPTVLRDQEILWVPRIEPG